MTRRIGRKQPAADLGPMLIGQKSAYSFSRFVRDSAPYVDHKNRAWLQTEYNTAVNRAHQAARWQQFESEADVYPNLRWVPSTSPNPGADHKIFWDTVLPINHPFWDSHRPGDRWNCKCDLEQSDDPVTPAPVGSRNDDPAPGLENNPAKDKRLFSNKHPYFASSCSTCPFSGSNLSALFHNLAGRKNCSNCNLIAKCIANTANRCDKQHNAAMKAAIMDIVRAKQFAEKRPKGEKSLVKNGSFVTGKMIDSKKTFKNVYNHELRADEIEAVIAFYSKPTKVRFIKESPLGEGKDLTRPKDAKNIAKKKARGVTHYNVYEFKTSNGKYRLKTEVNKKGYEIPYFIYKEKEQ